MRWRRIEPYLFFMKGGLVYYTVLAVVLFIGGGLLSITNSADAAGSDRISFASNRTGNFDIYVTDINGENSHNVTNHPTDEFGLWVPAWVTAHTWSPDGRFLAYVSKRDGDFKIYIMNTRTRERRRLTDLDTSEWTPSWSPDGKQIAFVSGDDDIYKTDVNGAHLIQLTDLGGNGRPAWSPDSKQIAFISANDREGKKAGLYVMNANGRKLRWVPEANRGKLGNECAWSPDGKQIAFSLYITRAEREHLCVIDVDGKNFRQLTRGGPIVRPEEAEKQEPAFPPLLHVRPPKISSPTWSPDGKQIAYVYSDTVRWQTADIYVIDAKGNKHGTPLVTGVGQDLSPAWVPEGFLSVSPRPEKQTTLWGRLKQKVD